MLSKRSPLFRKIQSLYHRRRAVSPILATILLIALTVTATSIVYFIVVPLFNKRNLEARIYSIKDTNKDSQYDQITLWVANAGTASLNMSDVIVWTAPEGELGNSDAWTQHTDWTFERSSDSNVNPSEITKVKINGEEQIILTVSQETYYRLEIYYSGQKQPFVSDWQLLNDRVDLSDLISDFEKFDLRKVGFTGAFDDEKQDTNNYNTSGGDYMLIENQYNYIEVLDEPELIPFYISESIVVFHTDMGQGQPLIDQPLVQTLDRSDSPLRARKLFVLGLAGSWGDEFPENAWALRINITYTDGTNQTIDLGHDYIDDWWYKSNSPKICTSSQSGKVTEINLGQQVKEPFWQGDGEIHTHSTRFMLDFYKYVSAITFIDPGDDHSAPHLLSLTLG